jgi:hypothetical protein
VFERLAVATDVFRLFPLALGLRVPRRRHRLTTRSLQLGERHIGGVHLRSGVLRSWSPVRARSIR